MQDYFADNRKLADSQVGGPLSPVAAGVFGEVETPAAFERVATELLHKDRDAGIFALGYQRARPFEMKWARTGA